MVLYNTIMPCEKKKETLFGSSEKGKVVQLYYNVDGGAGDYKEVHRGGHYTDCDRLGEAG